MRPLRFVECEALRPECLGNYLAGLGLLAACSQMWPDVSGCWRNGCFRLVGADLTRDCLREFLLERWKRTAYEKWWSKAQSADTASKADTNVWAERSRAEDALARLLDAHIVGAGRNRFNPILGTGGNIGRRDLAKGASDAEAILKKAKTGQRARWLAHALFGDAVDDLPSLGASGSWFVFTNKAANNGQDWFGAAGISPWSYLLAVEGALLLAGGVGRRLGAQARRYAVFPFVSEPSDAETAGEAGSGRAEFWAPLWEHPASMVEVRALLERGLARTGGKAASAPHEFAVAARSAGADAGVREFARFVLRQTTSAQVYEALPGERVEVAPEGSQDADLVAPLLPWLARLPNDQGGQFYGLRGPVEGAIIALAANPAEPERWQTLWRRIAEAQLKIDRNKDLRGSCRALPRLDEGWFSRAFPVPGPEADVARAIASIGAETRTPLICNVFGIEGGEAPQFVASGRPQRTVFGPGDPDRVLVKLLERRLIDSEPGESLPTSGTRTCPVAAVELFLASELDSEDVVAWLPALCLVDWRGWKAAGEEKPTPSTGESKLFFLLKPLFHARPLWKDLKPTATVARRLLAMVLEESWEEVFELCADRYMSAGKRIVQPPEGVRQSGERIGAALLLPVKERELWRGFQAWVEPKKKEG